MAVVTPGNLALPAAGDRRGRRSLELAAVFAGSGVLMLFASLVGTYLHLRTATNVWPPKGVNVDFYLGNMLAVTLGLSAVTATWGAVAVVRGVRRQGIAAFAMTAGFGLAFLNLLWYTATKAGYGPATHPYGLVVAAIGLALTVTVGAGIVFCVLTALRVAGGQVSAFDPDQARAATFYWLLTVASALTAWYCVIVLK